MGVNSFAHSNYRGVKELEQTEGFMQSGRFARCKRDLSNMLSTKGANVRWSLYRWGCDPRAQSEKVLT